MACSLQSELSRKEKPHPYLKKRIAQDPEIKVELGLIRILDHEKIWGKGRPTRASAKSQRKNKKNKAH